MESITNYTHNILALFIYLIEMMRHFKKEPNFKTKQEPKEPKEPKSYFVKNFLQSSF